MAVTTYKELADAVFRNIKDHSFCDISEETAYNIVIGYIRPASVKFQSCQQDLSQRDDSLKQFNFQLTDDTFILLCNYMTIEWLTSEFILTREALKARMSTSDFHKIDTKDMLAKAKELRAELLKENDQLAINNSYRNSKLFDLAVNRKKV
ncbi:MAG: hypothetical protein K1W19_03215 [Lachnospiraceae bacterium]